MRPFTLLAAFVVPLLGTPCAIPRAAHAQSAGAEEWRLMGVHRCPRADTLFGRQYRSHASVIRARYEAKTDSTAIRTPHRNLSWKAGSTRLKATEATIWLAGRFRTADSARVALTLGFVDSIYRSPDQATLTFTLDDTLHFEVLNPDVNELTGVQADGVPILVTAVLSPDQSLALAKAHDVKGTMGPFTFTLFEWELWEINAIYRGSFCGLE